jgi:hypothetical protein
MRSYHIALIVISIIFIIIGYYQSYYQHNIVDAVRDNSSNASMMMNENSNTMKGSNISTGQSSSSSSLFSFNPDVPILMPLVEGYYNGTKVYFIHTETSEKIMSDMMTNMINFPTLYVPQLLSVIPEENMSKVYVFTNGITGSGPYGGGPFMFQIDVFDSIPIQKDKYSQYRVPYLVRWNENATARVLTSEEAILQAEKNGELTVQRSEVVINAPIIVWNGPDGEPKILPNTDNIFQSIPGFSGEVIYVNTDEFVSRIKLNPLNSTGQENITHVSINQ